MEKNVKRYSEHNITSVMGFTVMTVKPIKLNKTSVTA